MMVKMLKKRTKRQTFGTYQKGSVHLKKPLFFQIFGKATTSKIGISTPGSLSFG